MVKILTLQNAPADGRISVNDVVDDFQLFALAVVCYIGRQRRLFFPFEPRIL
jgi:hypothetical protein